MRFGQRSTGARHVVDDRGQRWYVEERCASTGEARRLLARFGWRIRGWLAFRSDYGEEHVLPLPPRWRTLPDEALAALLAAARSSAA